MAGIIMSKMSGANDALFGKIETPLKAIILDESNMLEKKKNLLTELYNVEKSNRFAETVLTETDFSPFSAVLEGGSPENDTTMTGHKKTIEHIPFLKEFWVTRELVDDTPTGLSPTIKRKAQNFINAYYRTRIEIASRALVNATSASFVYNKAVVDLTTGDGKSLFNNAHTFIKPELTDTQTNYFYSSGLCDTIANTEATLENLSVKMRNFKDENYNPMGYVPDVIVIPGNRSALESRIKKVIGSERTAGSNNNDINTQYGNWTLVVNDFWTTTDDRFIVMSSEANKTLGANMFYNRIPLDIESDVDKHTRNYFVNGYCRFGLGFATWKHAILAVQSANAVAGATVLSD